MSSYPRVLGALLSTILIVSCGGSSTAESKPEPVPTPQPTYQISAVAVKGPLKSARVELYRIDTAKSDYLGALLDSGVTDAGAHWRSDKIENPGDDYYLLKLVSDESTIDLSTGKTPAISSLWSLISQQQLVDEAQVNITPATTLATKLALALQSVESNSLEQSLQTAADIMTSELGFGLLDELDTFTAPLLLSADTSQTTDLVRHRTAVEALTALLKSATDYAQQPMDDILQGIVTDLLDAKLDGEYQGEPVELFSQTSGMFEHIVSLPIRHLPLPGTDQDGEPNTADPYLVSDTPFLIAAEQVPLGTSFSTTQLTNGSISLDIAALSVDSDLDGYPDSSDSYPMDKSCGRLSDGDGSECYMTWLPKQPSLEVIGSSEGNLLFLNRFNGKIIAYNLHTEAFHTAQVNLQGDEVLNKFALAIDSSRLYMGFSSGRIAYLDVANLQIHEFSNTTEAVEGLVAVGNFLLAQDSGGFRESHYVFDSHGNQTDWQEYKHFSSQFAWNNALERVYFIYSGTSPNEIVYEQIDQVNGVITETKNIPYHSYQSIQGPTVISPEGTKLFLGSGDIYNAKTLQHETSIGKTADAAFWLTSGDLVVLKQQMEQDIVEMTRFNASYEHVDSLQFQGRLVTAVEHMEGVLILLNSQNQFKFVQYQPNDDNDADGVANLDDAFPADIAASVDTDNDGYPDSWNTGFTAADSTTGLTIDAFPTDSACQLPGHGLLGLCDIAAQIKFKQADAMLVSGTQLSVLSRDEKKIIRWDINSQSYLNPILLRSSVLIGVPTSMAVKADGSYLVGYDSGFLYHYDAQGLGMPVLLGNFSSVIKRVFTTQEHYLVVTEGGAYKPNLLLINLDGEIVDTFDSHGSAYNFKYIAESKHFYWLEDNHNGSVRRLFVNDTLGRFENPVGYVYSEEAADFMTVSEDESLIVTGNGMVIRNYGQTRSVWLPNSASLSGQAVMRDFVWFADIGIGHYVDEGLDVLAIYRKDLKQAIVELPWPRKVEAIVRSEKSLLIVTQSEQDLNIEALAIESDKDADTIPSWWEVAFGLNDQDASDSQLDADGDGLTNRQEYEALTLPSKSDSDGDGVNDREELTLGLNPLLADTDGDLIPDGWEVANGLDANDANDAATDADHDGISNYLEYLVKTDPQDGESFPTPLNNLSYSFEGSLVPSDWVLTTTPEFDTLHAHDGIISMAFPAENSVKWSQLFGPTELSLYMTSDCDSNVARTVTLQLDGEQQSQHVIASGQWQKLQLPIVEGYHKVEISISEGIESCRVYLDSVTLRPLSSLSEMGAYAVSQKDNWLYIHAHDGTLLRQLKVPTSIQREELARGVAVLDDGRIAVYNGIYGAMEIIPRVSIYNPETNKWISGSSKDWEDEDYYYKGHIDDLDSRILVIGRKRESTGVVDGVLVFDQAKENTEIIEFDEPQYVSVGVDGYIYGAATDMLYKFDPATYAQLDSIPLTYTGALKVDSTGRIYVIDGTVVRQYGANGVLSKSLDLGHSLSDISLSASGDILITDHQGNIYATTISLSGYQVLDASGHFVDLVPVALQNSANTGATSY